MTPPVEATSDGNTSLSGLLVVVLGPDGAGKSTALQGMSRQRPGWAFPVMDPDRLYQPAGLEHMAWTQTTHPRVVVESLPSLGRTTLLAHIFSILVDFHVRPGLQRGRVVVCDSYHYRFAAKSRVIDPGTASLMEHVGSKAPRPDLAIWLDMPLHRAWRLKGSACSVMEGGWNRDYAGFERLQTEVKRIVLEEYLSDLPTVRIPADRAPEEVLTDCLRTVDEFAAPTASPTAPTPPRPTAPAPLPPTPTTPH